MATSSPTGSSSSAGGPTAALTIGDLASQTGVATATLRMWEQRHGFPEPQRLTSGHRRYDQRDVDAVREVVRRRDGGARLDAAIEQVVADGVAISSPEHDRPSSPSVYAELRRRHPGLPVNRLRKSTLLALSWAIEDECISRSQRAHFFGAFQRQSRFEPAAVRWAEMARVAASAFVFADFDGDTGRGTAAGGRARDGARVFGEPRLVPLPPDAPMIREWAVVCDCSDLPVALSAWELPGQDGVRDSERIFEAVWTVEPDAVRHAARACLTVARNAGVHVDDVAEALQSTPAGTADPTIVTALFNRVVAYVDGSPSR